MKLDYNDVRELVEVPVIKRKSIEVRKANGVYETRRLRKFHLTDMELGEILDKAKEKEVFPNPYKRRGIYKAIVQALIDLGIDEYHSFSLIRNRIKEIMSGYSTVGNKNFWESFVNKASRNPFSGKDVTGRIIQNAEILQRVEGLSCYGIKLVQIGSSIHLKKENGVVYFKLATDTVKPVNKLK